MIRGFDEKWLEDYQRKAGASKDVPAVPAKQETITIILPFKLPTWNQLFAMQHWQRAKVTKWIKEHVLQCIANGKDWPIQTGLARKLLLTDLSLVEYYQMITPNASEKFRSRKKSAKLRKQ